MTLMPPDLSPLPPDARAPTDAPHRAHPPSKGHAPGHTDSRADGHSASHADRSRTLLQLLDAQGPGPSEYAPGLSSHLPMALQALHALGAPPGRLQAFFDAYRHQHPLLVTPLAAPVPADRPGPLGPAWGQDAGWQAALGRIAAEGHWRARFTQRQQAAGTEGLLAEALPVLWPGLAAAAFHGPIRVAHALAAGHPGELCAALGYWAARWQALAPPARPVAPVGWADWVGRLQAGATRWQSPAGLISARMADAVHSPPYQTLGAALAPAPLVQRLDELGTLALAVYGATADFTWLHGVTGLHAIKQLAQRWPGLAQAPGHDCRADAVRGVVERAVTAAALAARHRRAGAPPPPPWPEALPPWPALVARARVAPDEHAIKLVQAAREAAAAWGDEAARQAAWTALASLARPAKARAGP